MDALFGVVNIPNVVWIDEQGMIVRPAEPGWPDTRADLPAGLAQSLGRLGRARSAPAAPKERVEQRAVLTSGQDRAAYADAIREWVAKGADSVYALSPAEVVARSQPRPMTASEGAAHFELANHLWRAGQRDLAVEHFNECSRLQPDNWTYKRQAWSLVGHERSGGEWGRFAQAPAQGSEDDWPFTSDFLSDVAMLHEGEYYPNTM